jgi:hypothetical protein
MIFDKTSFSHNIRESYFLPHYLTKLFERKIFRRFECYFSHLVVHRLNNGKTYYNVFISSRLFAGMSKWFKYVFTPKVFNRLYYNNGGFVNVRRLVKKYMNCIEKINKSKPYLKKYPKGRDERKFANAYFQRAKNYIARKVYLFKVIKKLTRVYNKLNFSSSRVINSSLESFKKAIENYSSHKDVNIRILTLSNSAPTAHSLGSIFLHRLRKGSSINRLVKSTLERVKKRRYRYIQGMRIVCEGRFKRRQRAQHNVYNIGKVKTSSIKSKVDYSLSTSHLKYGAASIRIWLNYV